MSEPNIALVVLDTLRKDIFDRQFEWLDGVSYENAWSTTHYSSAAHASLFTGHFASEIAVHNKSPKFDCPEPSIAELLVEKGYNTRGFSTNTYVSKFFDFNTGFKEFQSETRVTGGSNTTFNWPKFIKENKNRGPRRYFDLLTKIIREDVPIIPTLRQGAEIKLKDLGLLDHDGSYQDGVKAIEYVDQINFDNKREFLFINLMDAHGPYAAPEEYQTVEPSHPDSIRTMINEETELHPKTVKAAYKDCVRYLSDVYDQLYQRLSKSFDVIITLSDHGEAFGERGVWGHTGLSPEVTQIPLVISTPNDDVGVEQTDEPVNLHDVFQTICELADVEAPNDTRGDPLTKIAGVKGRYKLLESHGLSKEKIEALRTDRFSQETIATYDKELHAIASQTGYAFETYDGSIENIGGEILEVEKRIKALVADLDVRTKMNKVNISEDVRKHLEDLGYA